MHLLERAARTREGVVATVGHVSAKPNVPNVIRDLVELSVDSRAASRPAFEDLGGLVVECAQQAAGRHKVRAAVELAWQSEPLELDPGVQAHLERAVRQVGLRAAPLPSGAGHDAAVMAQAGIPTGMLFVRSLVGGISHTPEEHTDAEAVADAIRTLVGAALAQLSEKGQT